MQKETYSFLQMAHELAPYLKDTDPRKVSDFALEGIQHPEQLALLLSPAGAPYLEQMAKVAQRFTRQHFGNVMQMYAPMYLSDYCVNQCTYCGFRAGGLHNRSKMNQAQILQEGEYLHGIGYRNVLLLTGESRKHSDIDYLAESLNTLSGLFPMLGLEVYPLKTEEYAVLTQAGAESLSLYQETFNRRLYAEIHPGGPKANFEWRVEGPERACQGGMRSVHLGVLLGLGDWRQDVLAVALHGRWLQKRYPEVQIGFSLPRMRPAAESLFNPHIVSDREFVQALLALRLWMPQSEISLSTREAEPMRDALAKICITRMSAGSSTKVGGYTLVQGEAEDQFKISDERNLGVMQQVLLANGLEPVTQDWVALRGGGAVG